MRDPLAAATWGTGRRINPARGHRPSGSPGARGNRVEYPDDDPNGNPVETEISWDEYRALPVDGLAGADFVRAKLSRLVDAEGACDRNDETETGRLASSGARTPPAPDT